MKQYSNLKLLLLLPGAALLCACASTGSQATATPISTVNYSQLANVTQESVTSSAMGGGHLRLKAVSDAALTLGAQSGLAYESKKLNTNLLTEAEHLRTVFNFDALILNHNILPPVLVESDNTLSLDNSETIRSAARSFKIIEPAKFITAPPTWRNYLFISFNKPDLPDQTLLPRSKSEQAAWRRELKVGWSSGTQQADQIFSENLSRLKEDYEGMILYRKLLAEHMVTSPYVASTNLGVTGDSQHLNISDRILRISALPGLQTNIHKWTPILDAQNQE